MAKITEILRNKNFFFLWLGQIISQFGERLAQMALIYLAYEKAPGSAFELAKIFVFATIPAFIIGPIAGAYSDRWNKKYTMIASELARGGLVLLIAAYCFFVPKLTPIFPIYIIVFVAFSMARFILPAKMSLIPDLVPQDKLLLANSLIATTGMIAAVLGAGIGGIFIMPIFGAKMGFVINSMAFFISALILSFMRVGYKEKAFKENIYNISRKIGEAIKKSIFVEMKEGVMYLLQHRKMHFVIGVLFLLFSAIGASYPVTVVFIQKSLGTATRHLGALAAFFGAGLFLGALLYGRLGHLFSKTKAIFLSLATGGIMLVLFVVSVSAYSVFPLVACLAGLFGLSVAPIIISSNTIVHELMPEELRGRAFSSLEAVMHLAFLIFMLLASILADYVDTLYILITVSASCIYAGVFGLRKVKG